jgi:hypothetical protein
MTDHPILFDIKISGHSNASQRVTGKYPAGVSVEAVKREVEARYKGTFGGRFEAVERGEFNYIAQTE